MNIGLNLLDQYDAACEEFEISDKVFKIVADSAADNKCAFKNELEAQTKRTFWRK